MKLNIAKLDIGAALCGHLAKPTLKETLQGLALYTVALVMVLDTVNAIRLGRDMPTWHWVIYAPVLFLFVWIFEKNILSKQRRTAMKNVSRKGFAMPGVMFAMVIMSLLAVVMVQASVDSQKASYAMRMSAEAFNAAESGGDSVIANWNPNWDTLQSGASVDLGWRTFAHGAQYNVVIMRTDGDTTGTETRMYSVTTTGKDRAGGTREVVTFVQSATSWGFGLGSNAAGTVRGTVDVQTGGWVSGVDDTPSAWPTCAPGNDRAGVSLNDSTLLDTTGGTLIGTPPMSEVALNDSTLSWFGTIGWDQLRAMASDTVIGAAPLDLVGCPAFKIAGGTCGPTEIGPRYHDVLDGHGHLGTDPIIGTCDKTAHLNWGSNVSGDPCYEFYPIVLGSEEVDVNLCDHCNAIYVLDSDTTGGVKAGAELDIELDVVWNGLILGRGCVEFQQNANFHGAVFVDGDYNFGECNLDATLDVNSGATVQYSSCVIKDMLASHGLGLPEVQFTDVRRLTTRAFTEVVR